MNDFLFLKLYIIFIFIFFRDINWILNLFLCSGLCQNNNLHKWELRVLFFNDLYPILFVSIFLCRFFIAYSFLVLWFLLGCYNLQERELWRTRGIVWRDMMVNKITILFRLWFLCFQACLIHFSKKKLFMFLNFL